MAARYLADTSALLDLHQAEVASRIVGLLVGGQVATCGIVDLDIVALMAPADRAEVLAERRQFPAVPLDDATFERALEVLLLLDEDPPPIRDLVVAAAAERAGLVLLHDDPAFERIASVTGQPVERPLAPGGDQ